MGKRLLQLTSVVTGAVIAGAAASPLVSSVEPAAEAASITTASTTTVTMVSARTLLATLRVVRESHGGTYERARFGSWLDADGDCGKTRAEVLRAESSSVVTANSSCTVK